MKMSVSSLLLLGYPSYLHQSRISLGYHIISDHSSRIDKIMNLWKMWIIFVNFGGVLYDKSLDHFFFT